MSWLAWSGSRESSFTTPESVECRNLLNDAKRRGAEHAEKLLREAETRRGSNQMGYKAILERVEKLNPDGPHGQKARQLLKQTGG